MRNDSELNVFIRLVESVLLFKVTALHLAVLSGFVLTVELRKRQEGASTHEVQNLALSVSTVILGSVQLLVSIYSLLVSLTFRTHVMSVD